VPPASIRWLLRSDKKVNAKYVFINPYHQALTSLLWFSSEKGFGFLTATDGGEDLFVHHSGIQSRGFRVLEENQQVEFDIEVDATGRRKAINVTGPNGAEVSVSDELKEMVINANRRVRRNKDSVATSRARAKARVRGASVVKGSASIAHAMTKTVEATSPVVDGVDRSRTKRRQLRMF